MAQDFESDAVNNSNETHINATPSIKEMFLSLDDDSQEHDDVEEGLSKENNLEDTEYEESEEEDFEEEEESDNEEEFEDEDESENDEEVEEEEEATSFNDDTEIELDNIGKVKVSELKLGYLRQQDYTRKTQEISSLKKDLETRADLFMPQVDKAILEIERGVEAQGGWENLRGQNPEQTSQLSSMYVNLKQQKKQLDDSMETIRAEKETQRVQELQERKVKAVKELQMIIPKLSKELLDDMTSYASEIGYSDEAIDNLADSHTWNVIYKSMMFDNAQKSVNDNKSNQQKSKRTKRTKASPKSKSSELNGRNEVDRLLDKARKTSGQQRSSIIRDAFANLD